MMTIEELLKGQETIFINKRKSTIAYGNTNSNGDIVMGLDEDVIDAAKSSHGRAFYYELFRSI
jgi:hypothetical protein